MRNTLSRKQFLALAALAFGASKRAQAQSGITARQVIERIQKNLGVPWQTPTIDTFKAGNPDTQVKGIATTMMATLDLLQRSARAGLNLVITHEPTFYNHEDKTDAFGSDKVLEAKLKFIEANNLVVWRFHDHWHARRPDGITRGVLKSIGWEKYQSKETESLFDLPATTLQSLARDLQDRLKIRVVRVVGDPILRVRRVSLNPGFASLSGTMRAFARPEVDAVIIGETREWEGVEYAQDLIASGRRQGLIILGHVVSEENGMKECAEWLKPLIPEVPVQFIEAGEPYWAPNSRPPQ